MKKIFLTKEEIDKKLCIHCKFCIQDLNNKNWCNKYRSKVDDSPLYLAEKSRKDKNKCGDKLWTVSGKIKICSSKEEVIEKKHQQDLEPYLQISFDSINAAYSQYVNPFDFIKKNHLITNNLFHEAVIFTINKLKENKPHPEAIWDKELLNWKLKGGAIWIPRLNSFGVVSKDGSISLILDPDKTVRILEE